MHGYRDVVKKLDLKKGFPVGALSQRCDLQHLALISTNFKWRDVAPLLLTVQQIEDITIDGRTEQERRHLCLRTWSECLGDRATYGSLVRALLQSNLKDQALHVVLILLRSCAPCRRISNSSAIEVSDEEFMTPPQTPPRPSRSRHTQTDETLSQPPPPPPPPSVPATSSTDGRVLNQYVSLPSPRLQAGSPELAASAYLSTTSCTKLPFKDCSTQTYAMPLSPPSSLAPRVASRPLPPLPPVRQLNNSQSQLLRQPFSVSQPHSQLQQQLQSPDLESGSSAGVTITYSKKSLCLFLLVPLTLVLGVLMLGSVITYGIVYALRN